MGIRRVLTDFVNLFYPNICAVCHSGLVRGEEVICTSCLYHIPRTNHWDSADNPVARIFWGRVYVENACSFFYFTKGSKYRKLLHQLKYTGRSDIGVKLGEEFGKALNSAELYRKLNAIIPVPLHPKRLKQRGYNQAEMIANGLSKSLGIPVVTDVLIRNRYTQTQTKKTREERVRNVSTAFSVINPEKIKNQHILLIDDVVTTGATLEICASAILSNTQAKVSIGTLAYASSM
ncbi:MAG: ComF family protein [Bacteroidales bacterium]